MAAKWNSLVISIILGCLVCSLPASAFTITASSGNKGTLEPSGVITADPGSSLSFTIVPDAGYLVRDVSVDGVSRGNITAYVMSDIAGDHTINATFMPDLTGTETLITTEQSRLEQRNSKISGNHIAWVDSNADVFLYDLVTGEERNLRPAGDEYLFSNPVLSGGTVVWEEMNLTGGDTDICIYNISSGEITSRIIGPPMSNQLHPAIDGNRIVWEDSRGGDSDIYLRNLIDGDEFAIVTGPEGTLQSNPVISGNHLVWEDQRNDSYDLFICDMNTGSQSLLATGPDVSDQRNPAISGDWVVWSDSRSGGNDVYLKNITSGEEILLTESTPYSDQENPAISGNWIIWEDGREGDDDLYMYDISTRSFQTVDENPYEQYNPAISGNRIVWDEIRFDNSDIYLFTIGTSQTCPVAGFASSISTGNIPLEVQFEDLTNPMPTAWSWNFGDGSVSAERNPRHIYASPGLYTVSLTVSTPACRNAISKPDLITVENRPRANFTVNRSSGFAPCIIEFSDTSTGSPTAWLWEFGDGYISQTRNPIHVYADGGSYSVRLNVTNEFGSDILEIPGYISVLNRSGSVLSTDVPGIHIESSAGQWVLTFDPGTGYTYHTNHPANTSLEINPRPENGIKTMNFTSSDEIGFRVTGSGTITGNFTGIVISSYPIELNLSGPGSDCSISYSLNSSSYPQNVEISAYSWNGTIPDDGDILIRTVLHGGFSGVTDTAYEIQFVHSGSEDIGIATFNLSVNASWVEGYGGRDNIWIIRIGEDTSEVLPAHFTVHDPATNRDYFSVESPRGMSRFALSKLFGSGNPFQLLMYKLISIFSTPVDTSGGNWPTVTPTPGIPPRYNPPPEIPTIIVTPGSTGKSGNLPIDVRGTVTRTITIQSADGLVQVDFPTGTRVSDESGYPVDEVRLIGPFVPSLPPVQYIAGSMDTGIYYSISPNGTTYNPPVIVTLTIPQMQWDSSMEYSVWQYDGLTSQWIELPSTLSPDDRTISFQVSNSGIVTVMKNTPPGTPMAERDSTGPKGAMQPGSDQVSIFSGMMMWLGEQLARYYSIAVIGIIVVCLAFLFLRRRRYYL